LAYRAPDGTNLIAERTPECAVERRPGEHSEVSAPQLRERSDEVGIVSAPVTQTAAGRHVGEFVDDSDGVE